MAVSALGLPPILVNMLETLVDQNTLSSWNIFSNKQGIVCVNIWFTGDMANQVEPVYYRKQTPKQIDHNKQRAANHRTHTHTSTEHLDNNISLHHKKRKLDLESPENIRQSQSTFLTNHLKLMDTPETVMQEARLLPAPHSNVGSTPVPVTEQLQLQNISLDDTDDSISDILPQPSPDPSGPDHDIYLQNCPNCDTPVERSHQEKIKDHVSDVLDSHHVDQTHEIPDCTISHVSHPPEIPKMYSLFH